MEEVIISIAKDFTKFPGPRYRNEGDFSGEEFRENFLHKNFERIIKNGGKLVVNLDGTFGFGTSFLEEVFGGLARTFKNVDVASYLRIISNEEPYLSTDIKSYIADANE